VRAAAGVVIATSRGGIGPDLGDEIVVLLRESPCRRQYGGTQNQLHLKNPLQSSNIEPFDEAEKTKVKPPPLYKVMLLNDDYTPMDFVVVVLQTVFVMSREKATQVMLKVHREGMGVCGTYVREVAAAKVDQVIDLARRHQHPLQCTMEET
jgi:ATP-dependent Clp protease adaptor protein ClpS